MNRTRVFVLFALLGTAGAKAQTIDPVFASDYSITDLGAAPGVPANYGGVCLLAGDSNTMLLGGAANGGAGVIHSIGLTRDMDGHMTGFTGPSSQWATSPQIDGGLTYGPGGVLFATGYPNNTLMQYKPGSTTPDKIINLSPGIASSVGAIAFVPDGPAAGRMKMVSYNGGGFYDVTFASDGNGTYDITGATLTAQINGGPEGVAYVPGGSPLFTNPAMLVAEYQLNRVSIYDVDANGDPIVGSRQTFITGLSGAEGAFIDPQTGDFIFSTFGGGNRVLRVSGFASVPEPGSMAVLGLGALALLRRRKK